MKSQGILISNPCSSVFYLWLLLFLLPTLAPAAEPNKIPTVAVITTEWRTNSHADVIAGRLVEGYTLDGQGEFPKLKLVSAYIDQFPESDKSRKLAEKHGFKVYDSVAGALTQGTDKLAVDGVIIVAEHGNYPMSPTGQTQFPKRRFWEEVVKVFEKSSRVVPVFSDKHVADNWKDCDWIYGQTQRLKIPFMAGSSLPTAWREPAADVKRGEPLKEILVTSNIVGTVAAQAVNGGGLRLDCWYYPLSSDGLIVAA